MFKYFQTIIPTNCTYIKFKNTYHTSANVQEDRKIYSFIKNLYLHFYLNDSSAIDMWQIKITISSSTGFTRCIIALDYKQNAL